MSNGLWFTDFFFFYSLPTTLNLALTIQCFDLQSFYCILFNIMSNIHIFAVFFYSFSEELQLKIRVEWNYYLFSIVFFLYLFLTAIFVLTHRWVTNRSFCVPNLRINS